MLDELFRIKEEPVEAEMPDPAEAAQSIYQMYEELMKAGFSASQAMTIVCEMLRSA